MKRFNMRVLAYPDSEHLTPEAVAGEREYKWNVTAADETLARRAVLERAWANGCIVSRFLSITERELA